MTPEILTLLILLACAILLFATEVIAVDVAAVGVLLALYFTRLIDAEQVARGFGNEVILFLGSLFIVTEGLVRTGALDRLELVLAGWAERRPRWALAPLVVASGLVSAVLSNTATVAAFLPLASGLAQRLKLSPSKLLMPLAFASILGGTCTLIGTSTNIVVSGAIATKFQLEPLSFLELTPVGLPILVLGVIYLLTLGSRLLPDRRTEAIDRYGVREYLGEVRVPEGSPWRGRTLNEIGIGRDLDISVLGLVGPDEEVLPIAQARPLEAGDLLLIKASQDAFLRLQRRQEVELLGSIRGSGTVQVHEILLAPQSRLAGRSLREQQFRSRYHLNVLAISHRGATLRQRVGDRPLEDGDVLLIQGDLSRLQWLLKAGDVMLLDQLSFQPKSRRAWWALGIFAAMIGVGAFELVPFAVAALAAAGAMVALRLVSSAEAYAAVDWRILIMVGSLISLAAAMDTSGAASYLAQGIAQFAAGRDPIFVVAGFYLLTMALTQPMSNQAAALVVLPVAVSTAVAMGLNPRALAITVCLAASSSFITPLEPACLLVYGPGRYRFLDFPRVGLPLTLLAFLVTLLLVPRLWPL